LSYPMLLNILAWDWTTIVNQVWQIQKRSEYSLLKP
jgi:hypothetical protein